MAKHLTEAHGAIASPHKNLSFHFKDELPDVAWKLLFEAHGETFLCLARYGKDYSPEVTGDGNFFSVSVRCLDPAARNKFHCIQHMPVPGPVKGLGLCLQYMPGNETIDALIESGSLFRIDEITAVGLSRKQYPSAPPLKTLQGRKLIVRFIIKKVAVETPIST
jgi:hypothetical protein